MQISITIIIALDWKAFEAECKKIVHEISDRFIDLGLEDHESDFGANELQAKQERFEREFHRLPFTFEAHSLQLPAASPLVQGNEDAILEEDDVFLAREKDILGQQIGDIVDIIHGKAKAQFKQEGALIEHSAA